MHRVKVVGLRWTVLLLVAAVTWSALPPHRSSTLVSYLPPSVPDPSGAAHEPAGVPHATGRAAPGRSGGSSSSFIEKVFALVVPAAKTEPTPLLHPERAQRVEGRWSAVTVSVAKTKASIDDGQPVDTDADWYAEAPDDGHATMTYAEANPGRARVPRRLAVGSLPRREAGGLDWYDSLGVREVAPAGERGTSIDALVAGSTTSSGRRASKSVRGTTRPLAALDSSACSSDTTRYKLVKLAPSASAVPERSLSGAAPFGRGLPAPTHDAEPAIVLASLGPRLPGAGTVAYPGLAASLPESTPKAVAFCPIGSVEKKTKGERWCTRADRGGVGFREGPMAFLHPNGKKRAEGTYVNGVLQGPFVEYATNGKKIAEGSYRDGKPSGAWTFWWENGKKQSAGPYAAGERSGTWTYFDEKGRKISQGELRTIGNVEKKQGRWTFWHPNGTKSHEGTFREGRKDGAWKSFDEKGRQVSMLLWREGEEQ